ATRLMTLLESLSVGVLLQDEHGRVVLANAAFVELFDLGLPPERLRGTERGDGDGGFARLQLDAGTATERVDQINGRGRQVISALHRNADRMLALVADLSLLAKLESGEIRLANAPVDLPALVRTAIAGTPDTDVRVVAEVSDGPSLSGDPGLLGQLVDTAVG